jgi:hypothetical protein
MKSTGLLFQKLLKKNIELFDAFNVCLVLHKLRPACLIEKANHPTVKSYSRYRNKIQKIVENLGLKATEDFEGLYIYTGRKKSVATNKGVGKTLGFRCPDEMEGKYNINLMVALENDPDNAMSFYSEKCNDELDMGHYNDLLAKIRIFADNEGLPIVVSSLTGYSYTVPELVSILNSKQPITWNILNGVFNAFGNSGLTVSTDIADNFLTEERRNYRSAIKKYIPIWVVLLFYCDNWPTYELFQRYINEEIVDVTWDDVDAIHEKWEISVYEAFGLWPR